MVLAVLLLGALGVGCVRRAETAERQIPTCRYRDFQRLCRTSERYRAILFGVGVVGLFLGPYGYVVAVCAFGYLVGSSIR